MLAPSLPHSPRPLPGCLRRPKVAEHLVERDAPVSCHDRAAHRVHHRRRQHATARRQTPSYPALQARARLLYHQVMSVGHDTMACNVVIVRRHILTAFVATGRGLGTPRGWAR